MEMEYLFVTMVGASVIMLVSMRFYLRSLRKKNAETNKRLSREQFDEISNWIEKLKQNHGETYYIEKEVADLEKRQKKNSIEVHKKNGGIGSSIHIKDNTDIIHLLKRMINNPECFLVKKKYSPLTGELITSPKNAKKGRHPVKNERSHHDDDFFMEDDDVRDQYQPEEQDLAPNFGDGKFGGGGASRSWGDDLTTPSSDPDAEDLPVIINPFVADSLPSQ